MTPETIGHELDCQLAKAIKSLGGEVMYLGDFKPDYYFKYKDTSSMEGVLFGGKKKVFHT